MAKIFHFGVSECALLGSLHLAKRLRPRSASVLLCNALGAEGSQAHRSYRVLAEQLEHAGFTVLRFDYRGTGDSFGDEHAMSVIGWLADIRVAADELVRAAPGTRLVLAGLGFGATLAALATVRVPLRVRQLVLWDPVIDGLTYLRELATSHRTFMRAEVEQWQDSLQVDAEGIPSEAMGILLSPALGADLRCVDLLREAPSADHCTVISTRVTPGNRALREMFANRPGHRWMEMPDGEKWNCDAALNAATVPASIIRQILASIETVNP